MKKLLVHLSLALTLTAALFLLPAAPARADAVTDTISIYIGYFGWEEDEFVEKATYTWQELDDMFGGALDTHEHVYSYTNGSRTYLAAARGFYIQDLLEYAGIDFSSIAKIDFFTRDQKIGSYRSFTKNSLFDMPRYYFPNLASNPETGELYPYDGDDLWDGAVQVESMLALEDYTEWDSIGRLFENLYDNTMFSANNRFHLFFGQLSPTEANTSSAAKYVYKLGITFSGTPLLSLEETNIQLKVGSSFTMTVNISAEDSLLDQYVKDNIQWSSNNEKVIEVDRFGNLTVKAEGEAIITAAFGSSSISTTIRVDGGDTQIIGGGQGSEGGSGLQAGGENSPGGSEASPREEIPDAQEAPPAENTQEVQYSENSQGVYILSSDLMSKPEYAEWVNSVLQHQFIENDGEGALQNARQEAMDADAQQLILLAQVKKSFTLAVCAVLVCCFFSGFGYGLVRYRRSL